jgi:hypothetical protein
VATTDTPPRVADVQAFVDAERRSSGLLGGLLLGFGWPAATVYALVAVPAVISAVALGTLGWMRASST